jgi:hypothetical protein
MQVFPVSRRRDARVPNPHPEREPHRTFRTTRYPEQWPRTARYVTRCGSKRHRNHRGTGTTNSGDPAPGASLGASAAALYSKEASWDPWRAHTSYDASRRVIEPFCEAGSRKRKRVHGARTPTRPPQQQLLAIQMDSQPPSQMDGQPPDNFPGAPWWLMTLAERDQEAAHLRSIRNATDPGDNLTESLDGSGGREPDGDAPSGSPSLNSDSAGEAKLLRDACGRRLQSR